MKFFGYDISFNKAKKETVVSNIEEGVKEEKVLAAVNSEDTETITQEVMQQVLTKVLSDANFKTSPATVDKDAAGSTILPVKGGRSSLPSEGIGLSVLIEEMSTSKPDFPTEVYNALENLSIWNADLSYAVDNIVQLGNTDFKVVFDDTVTDDVKKKILKHLKGKYRTWYSYTEGINGLITDLLAQVVITGCLSGESVPANDLKGIDKVVLVNPKYIRFKFDRALDNYVPYQEATGGQFASLANVGLHKLNTTTYKYMALRRLNDKPYAIPPMLSAFENIAIERDMMCNLKMIVKRLGILGFLQTLVTAPKPLNSQETPQQYEVRTRAYLAAMVPELERGFSTGNVVGFKGTHEFQVTNTTTNVSGAKELIEINDNRKMAGMKQDPLMLGRNFNVAETMARVILSKLSTQVVNYQKIVGAFLADTIFMELSLAGFKFGSFVEVEFDKPLVSDKLRDAQSFQIDILNYNSLYEQGVISQTQRAQALGWEKPDQEKPRLDTTIQNTAAKTSQPKPPSGPKGQQPHPISGDTSANSKAVANLEKILGAGLAVFPYNDILCGCEDHKVYSFDVDIDEDDFLENYFEEVQDGYSLAVKKAGSDITKALADLGEGATLEQVTDTVLYNLFKNWNGNFTQQQKDVVERWVTKTYKAYREDKSVYGNYSDTIPKVSYSLKDYRAMEYAAKSDMFYLGKFITDPDTKVKITEFIKTEFIENNLPIGTKAAGIKAFKQKFQDVLEGEDWKINRIITTTVNKMRNYGNVNYLEQGGIEKFVIRGVNDYLQCKYCSSLQGKSFVVATAANRISKVSETDPESIKFNTPFITAIYSKPEDMENLAAEELQAAGIDIPPFHAHCRDRIVADI